jgi:hypothetical protein
LKPYEYVDELLDTALLCITAACNAAFNVTRGVKHVLKNTTVCWWTEELPALRKRINALERRYQRFANNKILRQERRAPTLMKGLSKK